MNDQQPIKGNFQIVPEGLSRRDWFAGMALQGILAEPLEETETKISPRREYLHKCVEEAVRIADWMIAELDESLPQSQQ